ncbi:MAG TPA: large-conductance mechanosensitive channel protein MscL [Bacteroidales bacterium]|jgi:large conductance mechanosensitive channel|nr:large-conductance mechanosensitive channel protein MscL [Bacteroidales bacterium]HNV96270.1 large-conductance mechanosensitive channel protein MscL [Bacteroidales bacterium]
MKKTLNEFRNFAMKGNVLDLAVAVIIGGAFGKIVSSLVNDIIMPPIGLLLGNVDFKDLKWVMQEAQPALMEGEKMIQPEISAVSLNYGMFIQNIIDFLIIAFAVFIIVKLAVKIQKKKEAAPTEPPAPSKEEQLLTEIRDILKNK